MGTGTTIVTGSAGNVDAYGRSPGSGATARGAWTRATFTGRAEVALGSRSRGEPACFRLGGSFAGRSAGGGEEPEQYRW